MIFSGPVCVVPTPSSPKPPHGVTELLRRWTEGDEVARDALVPLVYDELRRMARRSLRGQGRDHTLQGTALVHEVFLRLIDQKSVHWEGRVHFFAVASHIMRRILVDHARKRNAAKRGGNAVTLIVDERVVPAKERELDVIALDDALNQLAQLNLQQSQVIELRFFAGLSIEETAHAMRISPASVKRDWAVARAWLHRELARR